jgi:hypothetical protein
MRRGCLAKNCGILHTYNQPSLFINRLLRSKKREIPLTDSGLEQQNQGFWVGKKKQKEEEKKEERTFISSIN